MSFDIDDAFAFSNRTLLTIFHTCRDSPRAEVGLDSAADPSRAAARVARPLGDAGCPGPPAGPCWPGTSRAASDAASASRRLRRGLTSARAGSLGSAAVCSVTGADQKLPWVGSGGCCGGGGGGGVVYVMFSQLSHAGIIYALCTDDCRECWSSSVITSTACWCPESINRFDVGRRSGVSQPNRFATGLAYAPTDP